jgi:hypothetical protein
MNFWFRMQGEKVAILSSEVTCELFDTVVNLDMSDAENFCRWL